MKGIQISSKHCSFTHLYNEELKKLNDYRINGYLHLIESLDSEIKDVSKKILMLAKEDEMASLLMTIPGIGYYSALFSSWPHAAHARILFAHNLSFPLN